MLRFWPVLLCYTFIISPGATGQFLLYNGAQQIIFGAQGLQQALTDPHIATIIISGNITLNGSTWTVPPKLTNRTLLIAGDGFSQVDNVINFGYVVGALVIGDATTVEFRNLTLSNPGPQNISGLEVQDANYRSSSIGVWPSLIVLNGSEVFFNNSRLQYYSQVTWSKCANFAAKVKYQYQEVLHYPNVTVLPDKVSVSLGSLFNITSDVIDINTDTTVGTAKLYTLNTTLTCVTDPFAQDASFSGQPLASAPVLPPAAVGRAVASTSGPTAVSSSTSKSLSTGAIVGIAVGGAVGGCVLTAALLCVRKQCLSAARRKQRAGAAFQPGGEKAANAFVDTSTQSRTNTAKLLAFEEVYKNRKSSSVVTTSFNHVTELKRTPQEDDKGDVKPFGLVDSSGAGLANIVALQEEQGIQAVELLVPCEAADGSRNQQIGLHKSVLDNLGSPDLGNSALSEVGLTSTWKIAPGELHCRMLNGRPVLLGEGGYGKVYHGVLNNTDVAVKIVTSQDPNYQAKFVQEIITLRACHNTHIVQFLGACIREQRTFMVMEYMPGGDLFSQISADFTGRFGWYKLGQSIALDVAKGLSYLHSKHIAHLDLKSPNVLLTSSNTAKIGDVGLGKIIAHSQTAATRQGSFLWAAPEQLLGTECSTASDIFAFGTVLWEICTGEKPLHRVTRPLDVPKEGPAEVEELITWCHSDRPKTRPTADAIFHLLTAATEKPFVQSE